MEQLWPAIMIHYQVTMLMNSPSLLRAAASSGVSDADQVLGSVSGAAAAVDIAATFPPRVPRGAATHTTRGTTKPGRAAQKGRVVTPRGSQA